jgi:hypothetical protein
MWAHFRGLSNPGEALSEGDPPGTYPLPFFPHPATTRTRRPSHVDSNTEAGAAPTPASPFFRYAVPRRLERAAPAPATLRRPASTRTRRRVLHPHPPPRSFVTPSRVDSNVLHPHPPRYAVSRRLEHGGGCCTHTRLPVLPLRRPASTRTRRRVLHPYAVPRRLEHRRVLQPHPPAHSSITPSCETTSFPTCRIALQHK